jgi:hypothetical protein
MSATPTPKVTVLPDGKTVAIEYFDASGNAITPMIFNKVAAVNKVAQLTQQAAAMTAAANAATALAAQISAVLPSMS